MRIKSGLLTTLILCAALRAQTVHDAITDLQTKLANIKAPVVSSAAPAFDHVTFGEGYVSFLSNPGNATVAYVGAGTTEDGRVSVSSKEGKEVFSVNVANDTNGGYGRFLYKTGKVATEIGSGTAGGYAQFNSNSGNQLVMVGSNNDGSAGAVWIRNGGSSKITAEIGSGGAGGYAKFSNNAGKDLITIGSNNDGTLGGVWVGDEKRLDYAESFEFAAGRKAQAGSVMAMSEDGGIVVSSSAYDRTVVGVISGAGDYRPAFEAGARSDGSGDAPIAMAGRVFVRANCSNGPIGLGDLLVASEEPGVAMKSSDSGKQVGAIIGKALAKLNDVACQQSEALLEMLVMAR